MADEGRIDLRIDEIPPSVNKLYTVRGGRKILSSDGRRYKNKLKLSLAEQLLFYKPFGRDVPLRMSYVFLFPAVLNKGYPKKAENKFKKLDVSNRVKVLEDIVCELLDVDDSQVISMEVSKWEFPKNPHVLVRVEKVTEDLTVQRKCSST